MNLWEALEPGQTDEADPNAAPSQPPDSDATEPGSPPPEKTTNGGIPSFNRVQAWGPHPKRKAGENEPHHDISASRENRHQISESKREKTAIADAARQSQITTVNRA